MEKTYVVLIDRRTWYLLVSQVPACLEASTGARCEHKHVQLARIYRPGIEQAIAGISGLEVGGLFSSPVQCCTISQNVVEYLLTRSFKDIRTIGARHLGVLLR